MAPGQSSSRRAGKLHPGCTRCLKVRPYKSSARKTEYKPCLCVCESIQASFIRNHDDTRQSTRIHTPCFCLWARVAADPISRPHHTWLQRGRGHAPMAGDTTRSCWPQKFYLWALRYRVSSRCVARLTTHTHHSKLSPLISLPLPLSLSSLSVSLSKTRTQRTLRLGEVER